MDALIIFCAKYLIYAVALAGVAYLYFAPSWKRYGIVAIISVVLSVAVGKLLGLLWFDPLPFVQSGAQPLFAHAANNGFPSDHTLVAAAIASAVFAYNRTLGLALWVCAIVIGVARTLAGVHHPVDIIAAALVAAAAGALAYFAVEHFYRELP